jgi:hypothetical protein
MSIRFIAIMLAATLSAAGVLALSNNSPSKGAGQLQPVAAAGSGMSSANEPGAISDAYVGDFKTGYADGFNAGATGLGYPDQSSMASNARGYIEGFNQGYTDGQSQQANLRNNLCGTGTVGSASQRSYSNSRRAGTSRVLSDRAYNNNYRASRVDNGLSENARKWLLIGGGAAAGAGLGGAIGGRKGALIGALAGGGTGTYLAIKKKPARAFNRRVSTKSVVTKSLIGAGAGTIIGALAGGKRGALAGAALGGGGGALWSLINGRRTSRR